MVFRAYNGLMGFTAVHRIILAEDKEAALLKARQVWGLGMNIVVEEVSLEEGVETKDYD